MISVFEILPKQSIRLLASNLAEKTKENKN